MCKTGRVTLWGYNSHKGGRRLWGVIVEDFGVVVEDFGVIVDFGEDKMEIVGGKWLKNDQMIIIHGERELDR